METSSKQMHMQKSSVFFLVEHTTFDYIRDFRPFLILKKELLLVVFQYYKWIKLIKLIP